MATTLGRRLRATALIAVLGLSACATTWKVREAAPAAVLQSTGETEVQVRLTTGVRLVLRDPGIEGDSLIGWLKPKGGTVAPPARRAFALTEVEALATRKNDTALNLTLGALTGTAIIFALAGTVLLLCYSAGCD
jgi:hypothetical protein